MSLMGLLSQILLLLACAYQLFLPGLADGRLAALLASISLISLMHLFEGRWWMLLPLAAFTLLCVLQPLFLPLIPCAIYAVFSKRRPLPVALLLPALVWQHAQLGPALILLSLFALMLKWKDEALDSLGQRYFAQRDELSLRAERREREIKALQREQENSLKLAIAQERNRIARDIHDNVGHLLSRSLLQLGAMSLSARDEEQKAAFQELRATLSSGMDAVRSSVHNTRQDSLQLDREVEALIRGFSFCPIHYVNHSDAELSLNQKYVLLASIKEALSNVMRHSDASRVDIQLSQSGTSHVLLIRDNGSIKPLNGGSNGIGLAAMEERVRALRGSMHVSTEQGFRILITMPREDT